MSSLVEVGIEFEFSYVSKIVRGLRGGGQELVFDTGPFRPELFFLSKNYLVSRHKSYGAAESGLEKAPLSAFLTAKKHKPLS